ncbi:polysaccharide deacetylase family protein [Solidesulfovibrio sp.]|uniref:polysaccharide deacetylase family protein n=1 Tax=Solidesulfovibrio sp. TaxID=2910990 RepID=UPI00261C9425|nr:polysaccharide deacetylase family protein [Solidesulfovibrio sp.]
MRAVRLHAAILAGLCFLILTAAPAFATTILVYHSFGVRSSMSISLAAFAAQLDYLEQTGHKVISMDELARCLDEGRNPPEKSVVIAIDDGWATVMQAFPELKRRDLPFTLFLPMAYVANKYCSATLSQADIDALKAYPKVTFGNHSFSHSPRLARDEAFAREDIRKSVERFREVVGHDSKYFAYPYGAHSEAYTRMLGEAGFVYLFRTGDDPVSGKTRPGAIPRIAAHRLSLPVLASVLRGHEAVLAKMKTAPESAGPLLSATPPAGTIPHNVE